MRPFELDYHRPSTRLRIARHVLAAVALIFTADAGWHYRSLASEVALMEHRVARIRAQSSDAPRAAQAQPVSAEEYAFARETVGRLSTPWDHLFQALESAQTDQVALLAIEPDAAQRTVTINGEAKDYLAALSYMAGLAEQKALWRVHLTRHEPQRASPQRPLGFTISAAWKDEQ